MGSEARSLAKKIAQPGQGDGAVLQALMALDPLVGSDVNRRALVDERFLSTLTALLARRQEMVISGAITLINSLSVHEDMQGPLANAGVGEAFARLLQSAQFADVKVEALTTLANVLNNEAIQRSFQASGGLTPLIPLLSSTDADVKGHAFRVAIGVSQYYDDIQTELGKKGATSVALASLLIANEDKEQKVRAARLLLNLAFIDENVNVLIREKAMVSLLRLVQSPDRALRSALVKLLVNMAGSDAPRRALLDASALQLCLVLLQANDADTQLSGAKLLTNLTLSGRVRKEVNEGPAMGILRKLADAPTGNKDVKEQVQNALFNLKFPYERTYTEVKLDEASLREVAEEMERVRIAELEESEEYTLEVRPGRGHTPTPAAVTAVPPVPAVATVAPVHPHPMNKSPRPSASSPAFARTSMGPVIRTSVHASPGTHPGPSAAHTHSPPSYNALLNVANSASASPTRTHSPIRNLAPIPTSSSTAATSTSPVPLSIAQRKAMFGAPNSSYSASTPATATATTAPTATPGTGAAATTGTNPSGGFQAPQKTLPAAPVRASTTGALQSRVKHPHSHHHTHTHAQPQASPAAVHSAPTSPAPATPPAISMSSMPTSPITSSTLASSPSLDERDGHAHKKKDKKEKKDKKDKDAVKKEKKVKKVKKGASMDELVVSAPKNVRLEATEKPLSLAIGNAATGASTCTTAGAASTGTATSTAGRSSGGTLPDVNTDLVSTPMRTPGRAAPGTPGTPARTPRSKFAQQLHASTTRKRIVTAKPPEEIEKRRANIAKELLYTENSYVKNMQYLLRKYYQPLALLAESKKPVLKASELKGVFSNLGAIVAVHTMVLESLAARITAWTPQTLLGDLFISTVAMLKVYVEYVNNFEHSISLVTKLKAENAAFTAFLLKAKEEDTENQHDMEGYLIQPVQRIPRYELLLSDLSRHTAETHADCIPLRTAVQKIRETAAFIDAERGKFENLQKLSEISRALNGKVEGLFVTGRTCVAEADVKLSGNDGSAWLFNDCIIVAEKKGGLLRSAALQLRTFVLFRDALFGAASTNGLHVKCPKEKDDITVTFADPEERDEWLALCNQSHQRVV